MKSAYELAMERLQKQAPSIQLTKDQKRQIAALEAEYKARIADRELASDSQRAKAINSGDQQTYEKVEAQLVADRKRLQQELEEKKEQIRKGKG